MLDETTDVTQESAAPASDLPVPPPPRRRRSASRPAGPPSAPVEPVVADAAQPDAAAGQAPVDPPPAEQAVADQPSTDQQSSESVTEDVPDKPKRTRRKAAAPKVVPEPGQESAPPTRRRRVKTAPVEAAPVELATSVEVAGVEPAAEHAADLQASLSSLEAEAQARRAAKLTQPPSAEREAALAELALAIGRGPAEAGVPAEPVLDADEAAEQDPDEAAAQAADFESEISEVDDDEPADVGDGSEGEEATDAQRRRRRRRGGRRRRRVGEEPADEASDGVSEDGEEAVAETSEEPDEPETTADGGGSTSSRRRRRRRRRGEDATAADDDPSDVVVRVREPRGRRTPASEEVTGIDGSTRLEAKRQRRREGRAAGRRRSPILSEAEFLARRESVDRKMLIRQREEYTQIAVLEDGVLVEHYVDRAEATSMIGNIYLGKVQNVLPSMEAAFVDIGRGRNAVLYAGEVDWDAFGAEGQARKVEKVLKSGQVVLVQVTKDPVGAKGARLTSHISIPGRYIVYSPGGQLSGISRKLPEQERRRLKEVLGELIGEQASVIVRTAAEGASESELVRDVNRLTAQWEAISKKVAQGSAPQLLYGEPDLTVRIVRDLFTEDFSQLIVDGNGAADDAYDTVDAYVNHVAPHLGERLVRWNPEADGDLFGANRVDEQIAKALERKVFLPSGGSLIIDRTEAMTVIDINTGRFTGAGGNLEATVTSNNLEAAEEIVRQLRLRDIGGIIVIDFIDMVLASNRELLLRRLVECLGRDRTRHQVAEVTSLGLVQMTRKKIGTGLAEAFTVPCEQCKGRGYHPHDEPVESVTPVDGGERPDNRRRRR